MRSRAVRGKRFITLDTLSGAAVDTVTGLIVHGIEESEQRCPRCGGRGFVWTAAGPVQCPVSVPLDPPPIGGPGLGR